MTDSPSGFITTAVDMVHYQVGKRPPEEGLLDTPFFVRIGVKAIGQTHHCQIAGRSAEFAAARGQNGKYEVKP